MNFREANRQYFISKFHQKDTRVVLSFSSGGARVAGHYSLIKLLNQLELQKCISEVWGTSAGGLAASLFSCNIDVEPTFQKIFGEKSAQPKVNYRMIYGLLFQDTTALQEMGVFKYQEWASFFKYVHAFCQSKTYNYPTYVITYQIETRQKRILELENNESRYIQLACSAAIPCVISPVSYLGGTYIDGGIVEPLPIISVVDKWQKDKKTNPNTPSKLLIIASNAIGYYRARIERWYRSKEIKNFFDMLDFGYDVISGKTLRNQLDKVQHIQNIDIVIFKTKLWDIALNDIPSILNARTKTDPQIINQFEEREYIEIRS